MKHTLILFSFLWAMISPAQSDGGILQSNTVVCSGNNNGLLTVSSYSGTIVRWEHSSNANGPWSTMAFQSPSYNYINLTENTYFRAVVQLTGYAEDHSNIVLVSCDAPSSAGFISAPSTNCINTPLTCTVTGLTGSILSWEYSTTNWVTSTSVTSSNQTLTMNNFSVTTGFRVRVQNGTCPAVSGPIITVTLALSSASGTISGIQQLCAGNNSATLTLNYFHGSIQSWESSNSLGGPFYGVSNSQMQTTLAITNLSQSTWYRANLQNGNCPAAISAAHAVLVDQPGGAGTILGTSTVCAVINTGTLQLVSNTAPVLGWEFSVDNGSSYSAVSNSQTTVTFSNIASSRIYRSKVKNGTCPIIHSGTFHVTAHALPSPAFIVNNACQKAPVTFTNSSAEAFLTFGISVTDTIAH
jgi:hypothetical protein